MKDSLLQDSKLLPLGVHLFKYAMLKEYYFDKDTSVTKNASELYFDHIKHEHRPFSRIMRGNPHDPEIEGWPHLGIKRGSGARFDYIALLEDPDIVKSSSIDERTKSENSKNVIH